MKCRIELFNMKCRVRLPTSHLILSVFTLTAFVHLTSGQCNWIYVDHAEYQTILNGDYYLSYSYICFSQPVWIQNIYYYPNFIQYIPYGGYNSTNANGWVIGPTPCTIPTLVLARSYSGGYYDYPYDVPSKNWQELSYSGPYYINNTEFSVKCSNSLTAGEITAIVIGSLCALSLILGLFVCIDSASKRKRLQSTQAPAQDYPVVYTTGTAYVVTSQSASAPPTTVVQPPSYDNSMPPPYAHHEQPQAYGGSGMYEELPTETSRNSGTLSGHGAGTSGYVNTGYN